LSEPAVHVVGGSVGALVAADALARRGVVVELHLPDGGIGGGFLPLLVDGVALDLGARLIELSYDTPRDMPAGAPPSLDDYRPGPHGHRPYLALVEALVRDLAGDDLEMVPPAQLSVAGRVAGDVVFSGDLTGLGGLFAPEMLGRIAAEAAVAAATEGPSGLFAEARRDELWSCTFADASIRHTGPTFHELITDALATKILDGGSRSVIAALHRRIWLPLFHPATLRDAARGGCSYVPNRPMYTLRGGGMGEIVRRLIARVEASPFIEVVRDGALAGLCAAGSDTELSFERGRRVTVERPVLGVSPAELFGAAGIAYRPERGSSTLAWVAVDQDDVPDDVGVRFVADPEIPMFRVTRNSSDAADGEAVLVCELAHWVGADEAGAVALESLAHAGIARGCRRRVLHAMQAPALMVPSAGHKRSFDEAKRAFDAHDVDVRLVGSAVAFGVDSFNEQVVQGLLAAQR
jgi:hypothetical protein